jgi:hypothetical protein
MSHGSRGKRSFDDKKSEGFETSVQTNSNEIHDYQHFAAFTADSIHLKKPSGGPKGLIGPPCHGEK